MSLKRPRKILASTDNYIGAAVKLLQVFLFAAILAGCATGPTKYAQFSMNPEQESIVNSKPLKLKASYKKLFSEGRRNEVLNLMEVGLKEYKYGNKQEAKRALDTVLLNIGSVYADNEAAQKARSLWYEEGQKDFKGEPYERSMAYFYRGLLFLEDGDYGNARASFLNGIMQDAFAEEEQNRSDFAVLHLLAGWSAQKMGSQDLADAHYAELKRLRPDVVLPSEKDNVLAILETGKSPRKLADGVGHYQLVYRRGKKFDENRASIKYGNQEINAYPVEDVFYQASTRGGRVVDKIIEGKVSFKKTANTIGSTLTSVTNNSWVSGFAAASGNSGMNASAGVALIGVAALALSANTTPRADTRYWSSLPDTVHVVTLPFEPGNNTVKATYSNTAGQQLHQLSKTKKITFEEQNVGFVYLNSR